jgi:DNA-binding winged helix-turn-helix (wHTH) protein
MKYALGDLSIDTGRQSVSRSGVLIALPKLSYDLLMVLIRAAPNLVSHGELMRQVWPGLVVSPETVSKRVTLLRDALGEDSHSPRYIAATRGRGYQIIAAVFEVSEANSDPSPRTAATLAIVGKTRRWSSMRVLLLANAAVVLSGAGTWYLLFPSVQASAGDVDVIPNIFAGTWAGTLETCAPSKTYSGPFTIAISNTNSKFLHLVYYGYGPDGAIDLTGSYDLKVAGNQAKSVSPAGITYTLQNEELRVNYEAICQHGSLRKQSIKVRLETLRATDPVDATR